MIPLKLLLSCLVVFLFSIIVVRKTSPESLGNPLIVFAAILACASYIGMPVAIVWLIVNWSW